MILGCQPRPALPLNLLAHTAAADADAGSIAEGVCDAAA